MERTFAFPNSGLLFPQCGLWTSSKGVTGSLWQVTQILGSRPSNLCFSKVMLMLSPSLITLGTGYSALGGKTWVHSGPYIIKGTQYWIRRERKYWRQGVREASVYKHFVLNCKVYKFDQNSQVCVYLRYAASVALSGHLPSFSHIYKVIIIHFD